MKLVDAVIRSGRIAEDRDSREKKQNYSQRLSDHLAIEVADGLRSVGFTSVNPRREVVGAGKHKGKEKIGKEREFQGGLGPKRVDVSFADERHGLLLAVSIKTLNFPGFPKIRASGEFDYSKPNFSKNVKNRFGELTTEAITLHLRFPFAVVGCLYAMPARSMREKGKTMAISTFERAAHLYRTIAGRMVYGDPPEQFEDVTLMLYQPVDGEHSPDQAWVKLYPAGKVQKEISEETYLLTLRDRYNERNPHAMIGEDADLDELDFEESGPQEDGNG
jgi:hypothetical protein